MGKITAYGALAAAAADDELVIVDVNDQTMAGSGTDKNITLGALGFGAAPASPLYFASCKWCLFNYDDGGPDQTDAIAATYAAGSIFYNQASAAGTSTGSQVASTTFHVAAGVNVGELLVCVVAVNTNASKTPTLSAATGHTWTQVGTTVVQEYVSGTWYVSLAVFTRVATSGDAGDTLTIGVSAGSAYLAGASGSWAGASGVDTFTTGTSGTGQVSSASPPTVTTGAADDDVIYAIGGTVGGTGTPVVTGAFTLTTAVETASGNVAALADGGAILPAGATAGAGVVISGGTLAQYAFMTLALQATTTPVAATLTANGNGVLAIDGGSPSVNDRVVVVDPYAYGTGNPPYRDGIYTVTNVGSVSTPWVLTRASDMQTDAQLGQYWAVQITEGAIFAGGRAQVLALDQTVSPPPFAAGWSFPGLGLAAASALATAPWAVATGNSSTAIGSQASAIGANSVAAGDTSNSGGNHSFAGGSYNFANGYASVALGRKCTAGFPANAAAALGENSLAYSPDQIAFGGAGITAEQVAGGNGDAQSSRVMYGGKTTNATPAAITPLAGTFTIQTAGGSAYWKRTMVVRGRVVARRTDTPGTDSAWSFQGVVRGDGTSAYSWVGGSAPSMTLIAQDSGASGWSAALTISGHTLVLTVTGETGNTICWEATLELDEVAG